MCVCEPIKRINTVDNILYLQNKSDPVVEAANVTRCRFLGDGFECGQTLKVLSSFNLPRYFWRLLSIILSCQVGIKQNIPKNYCQKSLYLRSQHVNAYTEMFVQNVNKTGQIPTSQTLPSQNMGKAFTGKVKYL